MLAINQVRARKKYNGIVFKISKEDLPAYFGHWIGATTRDNFDKPILNCIDRRHFIGQYERVDMEIGFTADLDHIWSLDKVVDGLCFAR